MFKNRIDAAMQLATKLDEYKGKDIVVLAIPKGGIPVGAIIAKALHAPLDVALSKKIGHPSNRELAIGAVSLEHTVLRQEYQLPETYINKEIHRIREELKKSDLRYHRHLSAIPLQHKIIILVDDGIATGNTMQVTAQLVHQQNPSKVIVAVPVLPHKALKNLRESKYIDDVVYVLAPDYFNAVGQFYTKFDNVEEEEAIAWLQEANTSVNP